MNGVKNWALFQKKKPAMLANERYAQENGLAKIYTIFFRHVVYVNVVSRQIRVPTRTPSDKSPERRSEPPPFFLITDYFNSDNALCGR